jgi:hypothetical protein
VLYFFSNPTGPNCNHVGKKCLKYTFCQNLLLNSLPRAPTSSVSSEVLCQYLENIKIIDILLQYNVTGYFRYVDILIIYNTDTTNVYNLLNSFNNVMPTMNFTLEEEKDNKTNFLDITISKENHSFSFNMYRKPTTTDTIILCNSSRFITKTSCY